MEEISRTVSVRFVHRPRCGRNLNVIFNWQVDMVQSELFVLGRLGEIKADLPAGATTPVSRVTFSAFPIIGVSLTSASRDPLRRCGKPPTCNIKPSAGL